MTNNLEKNEAGQGEREPWRSGIGGRNFSFKWVVRECLMEMSAEQWQWEPSEMSVGERWYLISVLSLWNNILKGYLLLFSLWARFQFSYQNNHFLKEEFIVLHLFLSPPQILKPTPSLFYCVFKNYICHFCCCGFFVLSIFVEPLTPAS